jgi:hypothetical protein
MLPQQTQNRTNGRAQKEASESGCLCTCYVPLRRFSCVSRVSNCAIYWYLRHLSIAPYVQILSSAPLFPIKHFIATRFGAYLERPNSQYSPGHADRPPAARKARNLNAGRRRQIWFDRESPPDRSASSEQRSLPSSVPLKVRPPLRRLRRRRRMAGATGSLVAIANEISLTAAFRAARANASASATPQHSRECPFSRV